ncbi:chemotaxis protein CheB [Flagellimonas sp. CMM7]|uniref:chemotaxis protein CheB n=1 Tax=Flagellimonas sp. CMM7 TaxID=2654676 RepID=UPI0013D340A9|nr:chemotaxis protein CheB [Flagellimonas sp. CMM7]UII79324.1 chemotaxis protein CheB [Flagellimonas sp. CMM7]
MVNSKYTGKKNSKESFKVVLFCGSSGAMDVLEDFLLEISHDLKAAIVVLLHRKAATQDYLVRYLDKKVRIKVLAIEHGMPLEKGNIYMVPAGYHCIMEKNMTLSLDLSEKVMFSRPSADVSLESFSYNLKKRLIAIIVSGANADGANGAKWVWKRKGRIIVQKPEEAAIRTMPAAVIEAIDMVDHIVPSNELYNTAAKYF